MRRLLELPGLQAAFLEGRLGWGRRCGAADVHLALRPHCLGPGSGSLDRRCHPSFHPRSQHHLVAGSGSAGFIFHVRDSVTLGPLIAFPRPAEAACLCGWDPASVWAAGLSTHSEPGAIGHLWVGRPVQVPAPAPWVHLPRFLSCAQRSAPDAHCPGQVILDDLCWAQGDSAGWRLAPALGG